MKKNWGNDKWKWLVTTKKMTTPTSNKHNKWEWENKSKTRNREREREREREGARERERERERAREREFNTTNHLVFVVYVGSIIEQQLNHIYMTSASSQDQGSVSKLKRNNHHMASKASKYQKDNG